MSNVMGYQSPLYHGTKGTTAATQITNAVDVTYDNGVSTGSTTSRGDGSSVPVETGDATMLSATLTWNMVVADDDASLVSLLAAARTGEPIALRYKAWAAGTGLDADCIISVSQGSPLEGEATVDFTLEKMTKSAGRSPNLNS